MIGFCRLVTDYVDVAYLSDVYVLKEYQGKGLAKWLLECIEAEIQTWEHFRLGILICSENLCDFYETELDFKQWNDSRMSKQSLKIMIKQGKNVQSPYAKIGQDAY